MTREMMDEELHLTKKDFRLEWFSGTGKGGQHRNKHQNCCRIIHIETGLKAIGTDSRSRVTNQRTAFNNLARLIISYYYADESIRFKTNEVIRNYHGVRNSVKNKNSKKDFLYNDIILKNSSNYISDLIEDNIKLNSEFI